MKIVVILYRESMLERGLDELNRLAKDNLLTDPRAEKKHEYLIRLIRGGC